MKSQSKMKVEIWSDVMCPFCYIGKRKFEKALDQFPQKDQVEVVWRSFQLDPSMVTDPSKTISQMLAEKKGWSLQQAKEANDYVTNIAKQVGLIYNFDKAVVANSFDAHRLSHLAKKHGVQDALEEKLFAAYFTEGRNTADHDTLIATGTEIGLDAAEVARMLASDEYADDVQRDAMDAQRVGARGVPFFVLSDRYAVSGAQESAAFSQALDTAWQEWSTDHPLTEISAEGGVCTTDGCD